MVGNDTPGLGWRIRNAREARGLTQREAAEQIGVEPTVISRWECGKALPRRGLTRRSVERWLAKDGGLRR